MYPIRVNLLSKEKQRRLGRIMYVQFTRNLLSFILFLLALTGIVLLGGRWVLQEHFNELAVSAASATARQTNVKSEIRKVNRLLKDLDAVQQEYVQWTPVLLEVSESMPKHIFLDSMTFDNIQSKATFTGKAQTREDLLALQKHLESAPFLTEVNIPITQFTERKNIPFVITAHFEPTQ